jgi:hypothetical protein
MPTRTIAVLALAAGLTLGVTACDDDTTTTTPPAATTSAAVSTTDGANTSTAGVPVTATTTTAPATTKTGPTASPAGTATPRPTAVKAICTPSAATLLKAWQKQVAGKVPKGMTLSRIRCHGVYAIATSEQTGADSEVQVYKYASGSWHYFTGGSAGFCTGVPTSIRKYFQTHGYPGCE